MKNKFSKFINLQGKYLTSLLFVLLFGVGQVWAADPDLALGTSGQLSSSFLGEYSTEGITLSSSASFSSGAVQLGNTPSSYDQHYLEVLSSDAEIDKVSFLISGNGSNKSIQAPVFAWATTATGNTADTYVLLSAQNVTANSYAAAQWFEYDLSGANVKCARIYRTTKNISSTSPAYTGSSTALGSGQTIKIYGIKVWLKESTPVDKYTVKYMDGTAELGSEQVNVGSHPTASGIATTKVGYTFASWQLNSSDVALSAVEGTKDATVTLTARYTGPNYASTIDFEGNASAEPAVVDFAAGYNYIMTNLGSGSAWDHGSKSGYVGYKLKNSGAKVSFLVQAGKRVTFNLGSAATPVVKINNVAQEGVVANSGDNASSTFSYNITSADAVVELSTTSGSTVTLKSITIEDIPALSDDATLSDLKVNGTTVAGFASGTQIYRTSVAYGTAVADMPKITSATATDENATVSDVQETFYDSDHGYYVSQVKVTAQNGTDYKFYQLRITVEPKLGVELIKALTSTTLSEGVGTATGYIGGKYYTNNGSGSTKKLDKNKNYGLELKGDNTFDEGDLFVMNITAAAGGNMGTMKVYESAEAADNLYESTNIGTTGLNAWVLPSAVDTKNAVFVKRGGGDDWNPTFSYIAVYRYMAPFIESFEIEGIGALTINGTNITAEVANDFNVTALTPTIKYWANGEAQIDKTGAQDFTNPVTYTVSSQYAEDATGAYAPVTYTVTITKVVPSATPNITTQPQGANYYEGATIAELSVVAEAEDGGNLTYQWYLGANAIDGATEATYIPTVKEIGTYSYTCVVTNKKDDKPAASVTSEAAVIAIEDDPAAIKLFSNTGVLNTTNFISATATTIEIGSDEYPCLVAFGSNRTSLGGAKQGDLVMYSATKDVAKIKFDLYNANSSAKKAYVWLVEEGDAAATQLDEIEIDGETRVKTAYYEFNGTKNRTVYLTSGSKADIKVLQAKVIESGNAIKQFGQAGYSLNLNKGRIASATTAPVQFEGATITVSSEYSVLNSSNLATKAANAFTIASPVIMHVERSGGKYYVYQDPADKGTLYSANADVELNTTGTWYFSSESASSAASFTLIRFELPKAEKPTITPMVNVEYCEGDAFAPMVVSASVGDGGSLHYAWFKETGETDEAVGADAATYTPSADGQYYVVVTNQLADHQDNVATSNTISVEHFASAQITTAPADVLKHSGLDVTLNVVAEGKNVSYEWFTCDDELGANPVAFDPAQTGTSLLLENIEAGVKYYKVLVSSDCGTASAVAKVEGFDDLPQVDVTETTTWNMANVSASAINLKNDDPALDKQNARLLLANIDGVNNNASFNSQALYFEGQHIGRTSNSVKHLAGQYVQFNVTVPGMVSVTFASNGSSQRTIQINGKVCSRTTNDGTYITYNVAVEPGSVEIEDVQGYVRISKIEFKAEADYTRSGVNPSRIGTLCLPKNAVLGGAKLYEMDGTDANGYLNFLEVENNVMVAGRPYVFVPENGRTEIVAYYTDDEDPVAAGSHRGMVGTFTALSTITDGMSSPLWNNYIISNNHFIYVDSETVSLQANRAYIVMGNVPAMGEEINTNNSNGAPRRRLSIGGENAPAVTTDIDTLNAGEQPIKMIIDGQLYILRGEKLFDAAGRLVK